METHMIKLVAFDWNGTIIDDVRFALKGENAVMKHYSRKPMSLTFLRSVFTIPVADYWPKTLKGVPFKIEADNVGNIYMSIFEPLEDKTELRQGLKEVLIWLKRNGIKSSIFSNHIIPHINKQLKRFKINNYFDEILARPHKDDRSHMHIKQKDRMLASSVHGRKVKAEEVLVIGDTTEEIEIGQKFGYVTVALTGGYQSTARLKAAKPDFLIHNLKDLKKIIQNLHT